MIDRNLRQRYSRQTMFPDIGDAGQAKLLDSTAVIIGCGALGSNIANILVRAGVGNVRIIDRDFIEIHNLQRQVLFDEDDIKRQLPKAIAAARHLKAINSSVKVDGIVADANYTNIERFCSDADVILDGLDNLETRFLINDVSLKHKIPWVYGGAISSNGMSMTVIPGETACLRCLFPVVPDTANLPNCETAGVISTAPAIIASIQATEAIKILVGYERTNPGLIMVDVWKNTFDRVITKRREDCPACHGQYDFLDEKFTLKTDSLCGQTRAIQVLNTEIGKVSLNRLAARLAQFGQVKRNRYLLTAIIGEHELTVFPDGRTIINTIDEALARELYIKYVAGLVK